MPIATAFFCGQVLPLELTFALLHAYVLIFTEPDFLSFRHGSSMLTNLAEASHHHRSYRL